MSFRNEYILNVDIKRRMTSIVPTFKQGDSATLKFRIFDDGKAFNLSDFTRAEITFRLPSNQTIVGEPYVDENTNMVVYEFVGVEMSEVGKLETILSIYSGTSMVSIQPFSVWIFDHLKDKDLSYIGILQDLIAEVQFLKQEVEDVLSDANDLKDELNDLLIESNNAEQIRNTNEQNRITSENTRISNENTRQQNEIDRKNAESIRESNEATRIQNEHNRQNEFDNKINEAEEAITDTKNATDKANQAADSIKGWGQATVWNSTTTYSKNNVVTYNGSTWQSKGDNNLNSIPSETNTNWILLALRGVDGTGAVSTVNGKSPDGTGNVLLSADEIGTYTQEQIDEKDIAIKEYFTLVGIGDKVVIVTEQEYVDAERNGMYWVTNSAMDFLPTETDHAATLLVYENTTDNTLVKVFNAINPTTAISYMRTYTYNDSSAIIHDSGWIEGGGGSGGGGGGNVNVTSYPLVTDRVSQTIWEIPTGVYNQANDSTMVFHNTVFLDPVSYTLTNNRLSIPDNPHTEIAKNNVVLVVFRNMHNMQVELDGANIVDGSIPLAKLGQDVHDAISDANNSWQKDVYNDTDIINLGKKTVTRTFSISRDDWLSNTNVENFYILIPVVNFSGVIKVTYATSSFVSYARGGAEVIHNIAKFEGTRYDYDKKIISITSAFSTDYFIGDIDYNDTGIALPLYKAPTANNPITAKVEMVGVYDTLFDDMKNATLGCVDAGSPTAHGYPWSKQSSQIPTYDAIGRWDDITRRYSPKSFYMSDINQCINNGEYFINEPYSANMPYRAYWYVTVMAHTDMHLVQTARDVLNGDVYERQTFGAGWNDWVEITPRKLFPYVSNGKQGLASAITGKGVLTDANDSFPTMINNINLIPTGVKYATGYAPSSPSGMMFNYVNGATGPTLTYITVGGLGFSPKYVIARTTTDGKSYVYQSIYIESADYVGLNDGTNTVKLSRFNSSSWSNINTVNLFAQKSGDNIFIPIEAGTGSTYQWFAFG